MALDFRAGIAADIGPLLALVQAAYRGDESRAGWTTEADLLGGQRTDRDAIESIINDTDSHLLVAEDEGAIVGCCHLRHRGDGDAYLGMFSVWPDRQGHGAGREIVIEAERIAMEEWSAPAMRMLVLRQRTELIAWYGRLGYRPTGHCEPFPYGDSRFGLPKVHDLEFVELAKVLPPPQSG